MGKHLKTSRSKKSETKTVIRVERPKTTGITGKVAFKCDTHLTRKDRVKKRKDKYAKRELRRQIDGE